MRKRLILTGVALAAVIVAVPFLRPSCERSHTEPAPPPVPEYPRTLRLEARVAFSTEMEPLHAGPPPWPTGNYFALSTDYRRPDAPTYGVVNMHTENFGRVAELLHLETVEVLVLDGERCVITDPRIAREWLMACP